MYCGFFGTLHLPNSRQCFFLPAPGQSEGTEKNSNLVPIVGTPASWQGYMTFLDISASRACPCHAVLSPEYEAFLFLDECFSPPSFLQQWLYLLCSLFPTWKTQLPPPLFSGPGLGRTTLYWWFPHSRFQILTAQWTEVQEAHAPLWILCVSACRFLECLTRVTLVIDIWPLTYMKKTKGFLLYLFTT